MEEAAHEGCLVRRRGAAAAKQSMRPPLVQLRARNAIMVQRHFWPRKVLLTKTKAWSEEAKLILERPRDEGTRGHLIINLLVLQICSKIVEV